MKERINGRCVWPYLKYCKQASGTTTQPNQNSHCIKTFSRGTHLPHTSWYHVAAASRPKAWTMAPLLSPPYPTSPSGGNTYPTARSDGEGNAGCTALRGRLDVHTEQHPDASGHFYQYYHEMPTEMVAAVWPPRAGGGRHGGARNDSLLIYPPLLAIYLGRSMLSAALSLSFVRCLFLLHSLASDHDMMTADGHPQRLDFSR